MDKLSKRQFELLRLLPRYNRIRNGWGRIERKLTIGGETFLPSTFNSLVSRGLVWGVDHGHGHRRASVGRLGPADEYLDLADAP